MPKKTPKTKAKKVLINGAGGFIGAHLVEHFLREGHKVTASGRPKTDLSLVEKAGASIVRADITDKSTLVPILKGQDVVVNVGGIFDMTASREVLERVNHYGVRTLCEAVKETGVARVRQ